MKATIYCPGPHLRRTARDHYDKDTVVIAVNDAAAYRPHDWLVACDFKGIVEAHRKCRKYDMPPPRQGVCSYTEALERRSTGNCMYAKWVGDDATWLGAVDMGKSMGVRWRDSYPYALTLAVYLCCSEIDVFGCDMKGSVRWDGEDRMEGLRGRSREKALGRLHARWESQGEQGAQHRYRLAHEWAKGQGVTLRMHRFTLAHQNTGP